MRRIALKLAVPAVTAAVLGTTGFAFMAFNSIPTTYAGTGNAVISGYNVSDVHYSLDSQDWAGDGFIDSVSFTLDHPASEVKAFITEGQDGGSHRVLFGTCTGDGAGLKWTCTGETASLYQSSILYINAVS